MTTQIMRRLYCINVSNDRLCNYLNTHPRAMVIHDRGLHHPFTSEYLQVMFVELNVYCKINNFPSERDIIFQKREEEWIFF